MELTDPKPSKLRNLMFILIIIGVVGGALVGAYYLTKKVLRDREAAMNFKIPPIPHRQNPGNTQPQKTVKTYSADDMKNNPSSNSPPGLPPVPPAGIPPGQAAVQQSLKTLEEINKINRMNQQLMEQQRRMDK